MRGELIGVWSETWREVWVDLAAHEAAPKDLFCELYRELANSLKDTPTIETLAEILDDPSKSENAFISVRAEDICGERKAVTFFENVHSILYELGGDLLANHYFNALTGFVEKYSLRYDVRRPCVLCPTLPGVFASVVRDLRIVASRDAHLDALMKDFENSVRDLRSDCSDGRIKTCIQKQVNFLEAIARNVPGVTQTTLGAICEQVATWPHAKIKEALKNLYGFASDYPGIRHGGSPASALRAIEMRDMVALTILLAGFTPYLSSQFDGDNVYRGI